MSFREWEEVRLSDAEVEIIDGDRGKNYPNGKDFTETGYCLFLNAKNVTKEGFSFQNKMFISQDKDESLRKGKLKRNDVILTTRGTVGNVAYYKESIKFSNLRINSGMVILRCSEQIICSEYFYWLFRSPIIQDQIKSFSTGSAQPQLPISVMKNLVFLKPPLNEQKAIAHVLSNLDEKIEVNNQINKTLEKMAQAIFKQWFVDFEFSNEDGEPYQSSGGEMVESELGLIPKGWEVGTLSEICTYGNKKIEMNKLSINNYVSTTNMLSNKLGIIDAESLPDVKHTTKFGVGDTLISNIRPYFKKILYCNFEGGCSTDVICFVPNTKEWSVYLFCILFRDAFFEYMMAGSKGTKMPRGDKKQIMNYKIMIPDNTILEMFTDLVAPMLKNKDVNNLQNKELAALRDTLLPKIMMGEIKFAK